MPKRRLLLFACLILLIQSCGTSNVDNDREPVAKLPRGLTPNEKTLVSAGNHFSFTIFRHVVAADQTKNIFISPLSISMALGMTLNGAAGQTRTGIKQTLGISEMKLQAINKSYKSLIKLLVNLDPKVKMNIANSLWSDEGVPIRKSFKDTLQTYFNARADVLDFDDPAAADVINHWVNQQTNGRIDKLIEKIPDSVVLYLINAIYFKGDWRSRFDPDKTSPADFHLAGGSTTKVNMMRQKAPIPTYRSPKVQMAQLAYGDSLYAMTILMPGDASTPINEFVQQSLTASNLNKWTRQLHTGKIPLRLPKFESSYKKTLNDILKTMGMKRAFEDGRADFSNINPDKQLVISEVMHNANITVDEQGSEAAAATSVGVEITSAPAPFQVNRPFVYLISERTSGAILFMGVMRKPGQ